jgi:hypothetical protein
MADGNALRVFERKVIRRTYDPVREGERWRRRSNRELEDILRGEVKKSKSVPPHAMEVLGERGYIAPTHS